MSTDALRRADWRNRVLDLGLPLHRGEVSVFRVGHWRRGSALVLGAIGLTLGCFAARALGELWLVLLQCEECEATSGVREPGWVAFVVSEEEGRVVDLHAAELYAKEREVVVYCPECAKREFG